MMRHPGKALALLMLVASLSACDKFKKAEPGADSSTASSAAATSGEAPPIAAASGAPPLAFNQCHSCHSTEPGKNGIGPTLHGIVGSKAAADKVNSIRVPESRT